MPDLHNLLDAYVGDGTLPGAVGLVARGDHTEAAVAGSVATDGAPMGRDSIFRFASITKPITAAAVMMLVEDGQLRLDAPVAACRKCSTPERAGRAEGRPHPGQRG